MNKRFLKAVGYVLSWGIAIAIANPIVKAVGGTVNMIPNESLRYLVHVCIVSALVAIAIRAHMFIQELQEEREQDVSRDTEGH